MADAVKLVQAPIPPAPSALTATAISASQIALSWTDNSTNEVDFTVSRSLTSGGPYTQITTIRTR